MDKNLVKYVVGETDIAQANVILVREKTNKGMQRIQVKCGDDLLYEFWHNPSGKQGRSPPKHSGGKKPYIMLMVEQVEELRKQGVKDVEELIGFLVCLGNFVEWNTGRLIQKRSKKSLRYDDLLKLVSFGKRKLDKIITELKKHDLLFNTTEGYFISGKLIKKGAARNGR
jgi:hypothetical protein